MPNLPSVFEQVSRVMSSMAVNTQCLTRFCPGHGATMRQSTRVVTTLTTFRPVRSTATLPVTHVVTLSAACQVLRLSSPESFLAGVHSWGHGSYPNAMTTFLSIPPMCKHGLQVFLCLSSG